MDDNDIIALYLERDQSAIKHTAEKYGARLISTAKRILESAETAEECENDTYLEAWNTIPPHEPRGYLYPYLCRIIRHISISRCRKDNAKKRSAVFCELTDELTECLPGGSVTGSRIEEDELRGAINTFLAECSEAQRRVFMRRYYFFDPISDICSRYGYTESRVKTMLFRLRAELREKLEKEGYTL